MLGNQPTLLRKTEGVFSPSADFFCFPIYCLPS